MEVTFIKVLLMFLIAFFAYMHSWFGSTMWNRPIVVAPLVGLALGDLDTGIKLGATLELVFMGAFPVGASNPPDFVSGTIIATAYVIMSGQSISSAVVLAVPIATLVLLIDNLQMTFLLTGASHLADKEAKRGNIQGVERIQLIAGVGNKVLLALIVALGFYLGVPFIEKGIVLCPRLYYAWIRYCGRYYSSNWFCDVSKNDGNKKDDSISIIRLFIRCLFKNFSSGDCFVWHRDCPTIYEYE